LKYPKWTPKELIDLLSSFEMEERVFKDSKIDLDSLNSFAWNKGLSNWSEYEQVLNFKKEAIFRLATRPEMESVWSWVLKQNFKLKISANGGLIGDFLRKIDMWHSAAQVPQAEREEDYNLIRQYAKLLVVKLQKYRGENQPINSYISLFPLSFKDKYTKYVEKAALENENKSNLLTLNQLATILPPLSELLNQLAIYVRDEKNELPPYFPKKVTAENAFRTYLINNMIDRIYSLGSIPPPSIVSKFIGVALDDYSVTPDIVRKSFSMKLNRSQRL
jgi:hypothetical protein